MGNYSIVLATYGNSRWNFIPKWNRAGVITIYTGFRLLGRHLVFVGAASGLLETYLGRPS